MQNRKAIIDIGYNAIRAVVYESDHPGAPEIFNNKFKNDILSLLANESLDIRHPSYLALQYLLHIFKQLEVSSIHCVATAVLRDHPRSQELVQHIKNKYNFDIQILSGEEEAHLTALGLIHGIGDCSGVAADLGGGSLELIEIKNGDIGKLSSLKLGTKVLSSSKINDVDDIEETIRIKYGKQQYDNLYLIGGAMRFIARMYLDFVDHPLKNLHNLEIDTDDFLNYLVKVSEENISIQNKMGRRTINLNAILVARAMINIFAPNKIIISTYGLKEGVRFKLLGGPNLYVLEDKITYVTGHDVKNTDFDAYGKVLEAIVPLGEELRELLKFSIMLTTLKGWSDQTMKPRALVEYILTSELPLKQQMRLMLALSVNIQSSFKPSSELVKTTKQLISKEQYALCQIIGHFLAIAELIDGISFKAPSFNIKVNQGYYEIECQNILPRPVFESIRLRLKNMAYVIKHGSA